VSGLLVPPHDDQALADGLLRALRDDGLRRSLGAAGRERVMTEFSVDQMVNRTLAVYERQLARQ